MPDNTGGQFDSAVNTFVGNFIGSLPQEFAEQGSQFKATFDNSSEIARGIIVEGLQVLDLNVPVRTLTRNVTRVIGLCQQVGATDLGAQFAELAEAKGIRLE